MPAVIVNTTDGKRHKVRNVESWRSDAEEGLLVLVKRVGKEARQHCFTLANVRDWRDE